MKIVKLIRLSLRNFKGIREFIFEPNGENCSIFGDNGTGKTTLYDAFCWALFDKDSQGKSTFDIKPLSLDGQPQHGLEHEIEVVLDVDGRAVTLKKIMVEKWEKKRGNAQQEFTGHTTSYYVDEIPVKKTFYQEAVGRIADEGMFKLLTSSTCFNEQLHWQKRREILLQVCGDISDDDVISYDQSLEELPVILNGRKLEDHRKVIADRRKKVNEELKTIPVRIDEIQRNIPADGGINLEREKKNQEDLEGQLNEQKEKKVQVLSGGAIAEKQTELSEIQARMLDIKTSYRSQVQEKIDIQERIKREVNSQFINKEDEIRKLSGKIAEASEIIKTNNEKMAKLRKQWHEEKAKQFVYDKQFTHIENNTCPVTGRVCVEAFPEDQLREAREKAKEKFEKAKQEAEKQFNINKSTLLESIQISGRGFTVQVEELEQEIASNRTKIDVLGQEKGSLEERLEIITGALFMLKPELEKYSENQEYKGCLQRGNAIQQEITALKNGQQANVEPIQKEVDRLEKEISEVKDKITTVQQAATFRSRIDALKKQERELASEYERLEGELYLTEQFVKSKVSLLESRINDKFKFVRFKLFAEQINGGLQEVCETTYNGVPYSSGLNHGAQINVGLDIIRTLSEHYGLSLPIFVDNSEAVTKLLPIDSQLIKLVVSELDKKLRIETGVEYSQQERDIDKKLGRPTGKQLALVN